MIARVATGDHRSLAMRTLLTAAALLSAAIAPTLAGAADAPAPPAAAIKHRFLAMDESRRQMLHVNQLDPCQDWTIQLGDRCRDVQLIGDDKVMVSASGGGFREYDLKTRKLLREVKGFPKCETARRMADGKTVLACNSGGVTIHLLDPDGTELKKAVFKYGQTRLMRLAPEGTVLFGSGAQIIEGDPDGKVIRTWPLPKGTWGYMALRLPGGGLRVATGYDPAVIECDSEGKVLRRLGGKEHPRAKELGLHFAGGFQVLGDGHVVMCNWTGHGAKDSAKGAQLVEFDKDGKIVWTWHDPSRAGTLHGVIILDKLDTKLLNDDASGMLGPVKK